LINVPKTARRGDVLEIKTLISHPMETGYRVGLDGKILPRDIITRFVCRFGQREVFAADFSPAIAANPFVTFYVRASESGSFTFEWIGDNGFSASASADIEVT
jgi:sulfur-oxidizing protein SoxZ